MHSINALERLLMSALGLFLLVIFLVFALRKLLCWMDERGWIIYSGDPPTYGTLGRVLLELQGIAQPEKQYVMQAKKEQETKMEADGEGGPDDPTRHLKRPRSSAKRRAQGRRRRKQ